MSTTRIKPVIRAKEPIIMPEAVTLVSNTDIFRAAAAEVKTKPKIKPKPKARRPKENIDRDLLRRLFGPSRSPNYRG
jgi:hypothetical protein